MSTELIIDSSSGSDVQIALLKDGRLHELQKEVEGRQFQVGDIYLGKVKKTVPGLNAAFVDVGYEKDAFLHYHDLGPQVNSLLKYQKRTATGRQKWALENFQREKDINKNGKIDEVLKKGMDVLVQVAKEPISTKGPRISSEISIAGRYLVLMPFSDRISVSSKIPDKEERNRLRRLIESIRPKGFGVIIRTVATGKKVADLHQDMNDLVKRWKNMHRLLPRKKAPYRILTEMDRATAILRDVFNESFSSIVVDDEELFNDIKEYIGTIVPEKENIVKLYQGRIPSFEHFGIERQIKAAFGRSVSMSNGAYLIVEHTEALHVIDVNSGNRSNSKENQEQNALEVNLIAANEIARQLRLRDMGGIIVVDFIDMQKKENRQVLYKGLKDAMEEDRAKHKILPPSRFGLVEITRQRVRPEMSIKTRETNPDGGGEVEAPILIIDRMESTLDALMKRGDKVHELHAHPFIAAYLTLGWKNLRKKWNKQYKMKFKVVPRDAYKYLEYHLFDSKGEELTA
ncbi:MAG: Rne/Rng family ribonuclease [Flavobacteriales bacterium]|nr:Rne/Rng family ribonuclease [Flavobacteriales bacterium]